MKSETLVIKTDPNGNLEWQKSIDILVWEDARCVQVADGGYIITGITYGEGNAFLLKTDSLGNTEWLNNNCLSSGYSIGRTVVQTSDGGFVLTGSVCGTRWNTCDIFLVKSDNIGNILWQKTFGGALNDYGFSLHTMYDGGYLIGSQTSNYGAGNADLLFIRTDSLGNEIRRGTAGGVNEDGGGNNIYGGVSAIFSKDSAYVLAGMTKSFGAGGCDLYMVKQMEFSNLIPTITGRIYNDVDSNCVYNDSIDFPVSNRMVQATDGPYFVFTDNNGNYNLRVPDGNYNIAQATVANDIFTGVTCPTTPQLYNVSVSGNNLVSGKDFFNLLSNDTCGVAVNIAVPYPIPTSSPCINQSFPVCVTFQNIGRAVTDATFHIDINPFISGLVLSIDTTIGDCNCTPTISGQTVTCSPGSAFAANKICEICIEVFVPDDELYMDSVINITASIDGTCGGASLPPTNAIPIDALIECAIDPNDKTLISPEGCGPFGNISGDEPMVYQIRFQNTGNAPAHNIVLKDVLSSNFDISTFKIISTSHPITRVELFPSNILMISYMGIELPDSGENQLRSHGFVSFSISPKNNLPDGTIITNEVGIYFDLNEPVITNTTLNTIRDILQPVTLPMFNNVCLNDSAFSLSGGYPLGGTYSGVGVSNGKFNPSIAGTGTHLITYSYAIDVTETNYSLNKTGIFAPVQGSGTRVYLGDDQVSSAIPVGFNFNFYGSDYSDIYISSNGFITFNSGSSNGCSSGSYLPHYQANPSNLISFAWFDLYPPGNGSIEYFTTGTAPERKFIVNFNDIPVCCNSVPKVSAQIILYEGTNIIEIHSSFIEVSAGTMGIVNNGGTLATVIPGRNSAAYSITNDFVQFIPPTTASLCANVAKSAITVNPMPSVYISASGATLFCEGNSVELTAIATGSTSATYHWSNGDISPSITVSTTGSYTVTVYDVCGTVVSAPVNVIVTPIPLATITASGSTSLCPGYSVILTSSTADSYLWSNGSVSQSITVNTTGIYTVTVTTNACSAISVPVNVSVNDYPCGNNKILICHIPPGNEDNAQTLCINTNALQAHIMHGDYCGPCTSKSFTSDSEKSNEDSENIPVYSEDKVNYFEIIPNPFKESTTINFKVPEEGIVSIEVYNYLGQKISDLFNEMVSKGQQKKIEFFTNNLSSGIYYAKLKSENKVIIKKMMITK